MSVGLDHHAYVHEPGGPLTLVLLHGTGADERDLLPLGRFLADDATLLSPRGNVLEGPMPRWFARHAEGVLDTADVIRRAHELADWVEVAVAHHGLDPTRLVAAGFSNGANIAAATLLLRPATFRAAALFAPMVPLRDGDLSAHEQPVRGDLSPTSVFVSAGRHDPICAPEQAEELAGMLDERGAAVELAWHDGGHQLPRDHAVQAREWLTRWQAASATEPGGVA